MELLKNMNPEQDHSLSDKPDGFFYQPNTIKWILRIFYGFCVLLLLLDFVVHRHIESSVEKIPAFYAFYGFIACVVLVLIANQMRKVLMRSEDYYDEVSNENTIMNKAQGEANE